MFNRFGYVLLEAAPVGTAAAWRLAPHLRDRIAAASDLVTDQAPWPSSDLVTDQARTAAASRRPRKLLLELNAAQRKILDLAQDWRTITELMQGLGLTHRTHFRRHHLEPLLEANLLRLKHPDATRHARQAYVVSEPGLALLRKRSE